MPEINSSAIRRVEYIDPSSNLIVYFRDGTTYIYSGVPRIMYETLITASSPGSFFNRDIRNDYAFIQD